MRVHNYMQQIKEEEIQDHYVNIPEWQHTLTYDAYVNKHTGELDGVCKCSGSNCEFKSMVEWDSELIDGVYYLKPYALKAYLDFEVELDMKYGLR